MSPNQYFKQFGMRSTEIYILFKLYNKKIKT